MSDAVEMWRAMAEDRRDRRARLGVKCPTCTVRLPKAQPSILLPGQRCCVCRYVDPRPDQDAIE